MMWTLFLGFLFMQQAIHTDVRLETKEIPGFSSEALCRSAGDKIVATYNRIAIEPYDDYKNEEHDDQPQKEEDQFRLMRPFYNCLQVK